MKLYAINKSKKIDIRLLSTLISILILFISGLFNNIANAQHKNNILIQLHIDKHPEQVNRGMLSQKHYEYYKHTYKYKDKHKGKHKGNHKHHD